MITLKDFFNSLREEEKTLFSKNLDFIVDLDGYDGTLRQRTIQYLNDLDSKESNFSIKYLNHIERTRLRTQMSDNVSLATRTPIDSFVFAIFSTFILKKDLVKMRKKASKNKDLHALEFDLAVSVKTEEIFNNHSNPFVSFFLMYFDYNNFYKIINETNLDNSKKELIYQVVHQAQKQVVNMLMIYSEKYNKLLENEAKFSESNVDVMVQEQVKQQRKELLEKYKEEKQKIINDKNKEIQNYIQKGKEFSSQISGLEKEVKKKEAELKESLSKNEEFKYNLSQTEKKLKEKETFETKYLNLLEDYRSLEEKFENIKDDSLIKQSNDNTKEISFKDWLHYTMVEVLSPTSNLSENELLLAKNLLSNYNNMGTNLNATSSTQLTEKNETEVPVTNNIVTPVKQSYLAPVQLINGIYMINNQELIGVPRNLFLQDGQVVRVINNNKFTDVFNYMTEALANKNEIYYFYNKDGFYNGELEKVDVQGIPSRFSFNDGQVIAVDKDNKFLYSLSKIQFNLDKIKPVIDNMGYKMFIYIQNFGNQVLGIDINDNNTEKLLVIENIDDFTSLNKYSTLLLEENNTIDKVFSTPLFYQLSDYYTKKELVSVVVKDNEYYAKKINDEFVKLKMNLTNYRLHDGDVVWIDEDNHFLYKKDSGKYLEAKKETSLFNKTNVSYARKNRNANDLPDIVDSVLIIGNPNNQNAYKLGFRRYGIDAKTIDGYSTTATVRREAKNYDKIVFLTNFASHENQAMIKQEFDKDKLFYPKKDGVNYIYDYVFNNNENESIED